VLNITGGNDLTLHEVNTAADTIYEIVDPNANIIFGAVIDDKMQGEIRVTVIATGFTGEPNTVLPASSKATPPKTPPPRNTQSNPEGNINQPTGLDIPEFLQKRRFFQK
jgi:cell division protein FtsZ